MKSTEFFELRTYKDRCNGCGNCVTICPINADNNPEAKTGFAPKGDGTPIKVISGYVEVVNRDICDGCGKCAIVCPTHAIEVVTFESPPGSYTITVGEMEEASKTSFAELTKKLEPNDIEIDEKKAAQILTKVESLSALLDTIKMRYLIEMGNIEKAREEVRKKLS